MTTAHSVLVVDDSAFMRKVISEIISGAPPFHVVGTARNGSDALRQIAAVNPAIVTLDIEMPEMDGLSCLGEIMRQSPRPVVVLSAMSRATRDDVTIRALELGAVDVVRKPSGPISLDLPDVATHLMRALQAAACVDVAALRRGVGSPLRPAHGVARTQDAALRVVAIAASTGGPRALGQLLARLPSHLDAALLVVQHMPPGFTRSLALRLDQVCGLTVVEGEGDMPIRHGQVYVAPGGSHMRCVRAGDAARIALDDRPPLWGLRPSADLLFASLPGVAPAAMIGVVLTGMGRDGAAGLAAIRRAGGVGIVQDRATAVVYGMPQAALTEAGADYVEPIERVAARITQVLEKNFSREVA
jgi:two-component system, chemotaxis family, protein-glutamate methylesterase/glutaminase